MTVSTTRHIHGLPVLLATFPVTRGIGARSVQGTMATQSPSRTGALRPSNDALRAVAMRSALAARLWFSRMGLGPNDGVQAADIVLAHAGSLTGSDTSSNPSWLLDGARTIRLGEFHGVSDALRPDIVAHEYSHGVIERYIPAKTPEANALNEALADVFAVAIENRDLDVDGRPLAIGTGVWKLSQIPPGGFGRSDDGGAHALMGIATHPAYVVAQSCGRDAMAAIYLRAMTNHVMPGAQNFAGFALATIIAAGELYGTESAQYRAIWRGWDEVGMTHDVIASQFAPQPSA